MKIHTILIAALALLAIGPVTAGEDSPLDPSEISLKGASNYLDELIDDAERIGTAGFVYYDPRNHAYGWGARTTFSLGKGNRAHIDVFSPDWDNQNSEDTYAFTWFEHDFGWLSGTTLDPFIAVGVGGNLEAGDFGGGIGLGIRWKPDPNAKWHLGVQGSALNLGGDPAFLVGVGAGISL